VVEVLGEEEEGRVFDDGSFGGVGWGWRGRTQPPCTMQGRGDQGKYEDDGQLLEHWLTCLGVPRGQSACVIAWFS
jgi:hypothetical protein